jgi:ABC-2 type transport system ATP-binding protein
MLASEPPVWAIAHERIRYLPIQTRGDMSAIEISGLTKRFGAVSAVDRLTFAVAGGTVTGFLGANGAGKTTTMRMLLGLIAPTEGTAKINGRAYRDLPDRTHHVGATLEATSLHPGRTARDHLRVRALAGRIAARRVSEVLDLVDLTAAADRRISGFSLGMRQRLGLASALLGDPEVLILDEPANGLDPEGVRWLRGLLKDLGAAGRTILVSSHALAEVALTADHVVVIDHGRLVTEAALDALLATQREFVSVRTADPRRLTRILADEGGTTTVRGDRLEVVGLSSEQIGVIAARHGIPLFETVATTPDLEEVFLSLTAAGRKDLV